MHVAVEPYRRCQLTRLIRVYVVQYWEAEVTDGVLVLEMWCQALVAMPQFKALASTVNR